jgi:UDP-2,3-diacylglucosamine hydrolase
MTTLFVSDLHLDADRPDIGNQFLGFLKSEATEAEALYILGDLFEAWIGDDDPNAHYAVIKMALRALSDKGIPVYFMHGNRDFMVGEQFANETGVTILPDPYPITMYGEKALLSHGDAMCTDDVQYQQIRLMTRNPQWQAAILEKSLGERLAFAESARQQSLERAINLDDEIMDVNDDAVKKVMLEHGVDVLLHGHTHRPAIHKLDLDGRKAKRVVLGDWYDQGSIVRWDLGGPVLSEISR